MSIKVSVVVLTYNHQDFIAKAIESILSQKVNFKIEIIIADDSSTDKTSAIIEQLSLEKPEIITVNSSKENKGVRKNILGIVEKVKGEYLAILDGDDYWENDLKLQKQVDFLESNKEYNGIFHDAKIMHIDTSDKVLFHNKYLYSQNYQFQEEIFPSDLISRTVILPSSSALLRLGKLTNNDWELITDNYSFLWKLCCLIIRGSKFYFVNEPWSVYRNHYKGISKNNNDKFRLSHVRFLKNLLGDNYYRNHKYRVYQAIANEYKLLLDSKSENKKGVFRKYVWSEICKIWYYRKTIAR
ncbi:MAG: glycosyltransferase [Bacteroidia bacterium]